MVIIVFPVCCRRDLNCESDSLGTEVTQTIYRRSTLLAISLLFLVSLCYSLSMASMILGLNEQRDSLHLKFEELRKVPSGALAIDVDLVENLIPPACIAVMISRSRGSLHSVEHSYSKVLRCAGVFVCSKCPASRRPVISQLDSETVAPMKNTVYSRLIRSVLYK